MIKKKQNNIKPGSVEKRQLLDVLTRFPHTLIRVVDTWKTQMGFPDLTGLFESQDQQALVETLYDFFNRGISTGGSFPTYFLFDTAALIEEQLYRYIASKPTTYLNTQSIVADALALYASPTTDIRERSAGPLLQSIWKSIVCFQARQSCAAKMSDAFSEFDETKVFRTIEVIKGGEEECGFVNASELYYEAKEKDTVMFPTGFNPLDMALNGGMYSDASLLLFGNNGAGKTTIANQLMYSMASKVFSKRNELVVYCSAEQSPDEHFRCGLTYATKLTQSEVRRNIHNPATFKRFLNEKITQPDLRQSLEQRMEEFLRVTSETLYYIRYPKKGSVNIADWLPERLMELQQSTGKKVGACAVDWFGRVACGKPDETKLVGEMNVTAGRLTDMMDSDGGFNSILIVLAQAMAAGYGSKALKATDIGNAKNITDSFENVCGITTIEAIHDTEDASTNSVNASRKKYADIQMLNLVKTRFGEPCDIPFRRDFGTSRITEAAFSR